MRGALRYKAEYVYTIVKCVGLGGTEDKILLGFSITESRGLLFSFMVLECWTNQYLFLLCFVTYSENTLNSITVIGTSMMSLFYQASNDWFQVLLCLLVLGENLQVG